MTYRGGLFSTHGAASTGKKYSMVHVVRFFFFDIICLLWMTNEIQDLNHKRMIARAETIRDFSLAI